MNKLAVLFLFAAGPLYPQSADIPPGPITCGQAGEFAQWVVNYKAPANPAGGKPAIKQVLVVKTKNIKHEKLIDDSGPATESWSNGVFVAAKEPGYKSVIIRVRPQTGPADDFPELDWVSRSTLTGTQSIDGRPCLVFGTSEQSLRFDDPQLFQSLTADGKGAGEKTKITAAIDAVSRLPVRLEYSGMVRSYRFLEPPTAMLVFPEEFSNAAKATKERIEAMTKPLSRP